MKILNFSELGIEDHEFEIITHDDGGGVDILFHSEEAEEIFKKAAVRADMSPEEYFKRLIFPD